MSSSSFTSPTSSFSEFFPGYLSTPYSSFDSPSAMYTEHGKNGQRFDPYSTDSSSTVSSPSKPTVTRRKKATRPTAAAAAVTEIVYKNKNCKAMKQPKEEYAAFDADRILHEDPTLGKFNHEKKQFWFFTFDLLLNPEMRNVISWTGRGREFIINSIDDFISLWTEEQGLKRQLLKDTIYRNLRAAYKRRIMIPVKTSDNRFAFHTEPSIHKGMTPAELTTFINRFKKDAPVSAVKSVKKATTKQPIYPTPAPSTDSEVSSSSTVSHSATVPLTSYDNIDYFFNPNPTYPIPSDSYWNPPPQPFNPYPTNEYSTDSQWNLTPSVADFGIQPTQYPDYLNL